MKLPNEISWNILKFMRHPTAEIIKDIISGNELINDMFNDEDISGGYLFCWTMNGVLRYDCFNCGKIKTRDIYCFNCSNHYRMYCH